MYFKIMPMTLKVTKGEPDTYTVTAGIKAFFSIGSRDGGKINLVLHQSAHKKWVAKLDIMIKGQQKVSYDLERTGKV